MILALISNSQDMMICLNDLKFLLPFSFHKDLSNQTRFLFLLQYSKETRKEIDFFYHYDDLYQNEFS